MSTDNLEDEKVITELEKKSEEKIVERMKASVEHIIDKYNVDILGFGRSIYQANPKKWRQLQTESGNNYLKDISVHYKANVDINRIGIIDKSFINDLKE
ncbi:hypothetical protein D3C77_524590 [compost metagenome]